MKNVNKALGVRDDRLSDCPGTPNCVCTHASDDKRRMTPLRFEGDADAAWRRLKGVLAAMGRMNVVAERDGYLHVEAVSRLFRFVDDVEFLLEREANVIHFRSASRLGRYDFGANRARMEGIREAFERAMHAAGVAGA